MSEHRQRQASLNHTLAGMSALTSTSSGQTEADRAEALLELAIGLVDSAIDILEHHISTDDELRKSSRLMPGGTVGKHFRHVIETYRAFVLPLQPYGTTLPSEQVEMNYDAILPSTRRPVARSITSCRKAMRGIRNDLKAWGDRCRARGSEGLAEEMTVPVRLIAITPTKQEVESSVGRELWFCSLHAIHHFSMLRTIAVHELGLKLPEEFGTAPSTLLYRGIKPNSSKTAPPVKSKL